MNRIGYITAILLAVLLCGSCINEEYAGPDPDLPTRTIIVYLGGDNNLSEETGRKIEALRQGWTYTGNKCLIYQDSRDGARLLRLRGGCRTTPTPYVETVREYGAENSASAETFALVLREVAAEYPADSYGLIFFSHASGWLPAGALQNLARIGLGIACVPDYMLASSAEIISPGFTPVYPSALWLLCDTSVEMRTALEGFGRAYMDYVVANYTGAHRSATLSLTDIREISPLAARMQAALRTHSAEAPDLSRLQHFDRPGSYGDSPALPRFFDLGEWAELRVAPAGYAALRAQLERTVVWKAATETFMNGYNGFAIRRHSGLTTYVEQDAFPDLNEAYRRSAWYRATRGGNK